MQMPSCICQAHQVVLHYCKEPGANVMSMSSSYAPITDHVLHEMARILLRQRKVLLPDNIRQAARCM